MLIRGSAIGDAYRLYTNAQRDDIGFHFASIPPELPYPEPAEDFDRAFMQYLFDFGGRHFESGGLWSDKPPFVVTEIPETQDPE